MAASDAAADDMRQSVVMALEYVHDLRADITDPEVPPRRLAKAIMRDMRSSLPVPAIYAALKVLHRLQIFAQLTADAFEEEEAVPDLPPSLSHVDFTVKQIWRKWLAALQKRASRRSDWEDAEWNYYGEFAMALRSIIEYNTRRYFDISFFDDENEDEDEASSEGADGESVGQKKRAKGASQAQDAPQEKDAPEPGPVPEGVKRIAVPTA